MRSGITTKDETSAAPHRTLKMPNELSRDTGTPLRAPRDSSRNSGRRREIAQHIAEVLEKIVAWPMTGADERARDYIRHWILDLKQLTQFIEVVLDCRQQHLGDDFRVLDVGTSLGILPMTLKRMGITACACDHPRQGGYGPWIEKEGVPYSEFDLKEGELPYEDCSFDVITFKQVIEHLPFSAKPAFKSFYRVLRPGGLLVLSTPNIARLSTFVRLLLRKTVHPPIEDFFNSEFQIGRAHV